MLFGKCIDGKAHALARLNAADIGFINRSFHLHVGQVFGNDEKFWCLEAGSNCLPRIHAAFDHDTIHRRANFGAP